MGDREGHDRVRPSVRGEGEDARASVDEDRSCVWGEPSRKRDTLDDALVTRKAAARGLAEAAQQANFTAEQMQRLGGILENGEEADPDVFQTLDVALQRVTLGPDQAIEALFARVGMKVPKKTLDQLFGDEKPRIVRHVGLMSAEQKRGEAGHPQYLQQLDLVAEGLVRAAYLRVGTSQALKDQIALGDTKFPDYGSILGALGGPLDKAKAPLQVVHQLRSDKTEYSHRGQKPKPEDVTNAEQNFVTGTKICLGILST